MFQDEAEKTNLPAIFLDVCYADNYFMRALMRTRLGLFVWLFFYFFCPRISSALTCGIASVFSLSLFLYFFLPSRAASSPPPPPSRLVARPSTLSRRGCPLRLFAPAVSPHLSTNELSLSRRNRSTSRRPFCIFYSSPCVYFVYFCLKRIKEKTHFLTPLSLVSVLRNGVRFFPVGRSLTPTRCLGFLNGLQQWRRAIE